MTPPTSDIPPWPPTSDIPPRAEHCGYFVCRCNFHLHSTMQSINTVCRSKGGCSGLGTMVCIFPHQQHYSYITRCSVWSLTLCCRVNISSLVANPQEDAYRSSLVFRSRCIVHRCNIPLVKSYNTLNKLNTYCTCCYSQLGSLNNGSSHILSLSTVSCVIVAIMWLSQGRP